MSSENEIKFSSHFHLSVWNTSQGRGGGLLWAFYWQNWSTRWFECLTLQFCRQVIKMLHKYWQMDAVKWNRHSAVLIWANKNIYEPNIQSIPHLCGWQISNLFTIHLRIHWFKQYKIKIISWLLVLLHNQSAVVLSASLILHHHLIEFLRNMMHSYF